VDRETGWGRVALINCRECGTEVSTEAVSCPKCGAVQKKPARSGCLVLFLILLGVPILLVVVGQNSLHDAAVENQRAAMKSVSATPTPAPAPGAQWSYHQSDDDMSKGRVYEAHVDSSNTVSFAFPYGGEQHATLTIRTHPRFGKDVIFNIQRGQFLCRSYQNCGVLVRFDDQSATSYAGRGPSDNSTTTVFVLGYDAFVSRMLKAKTARISTEIYQEGNPVFEFDVTGFDPKKMAPNKP
jgi:hypothetical protein